MRLNTLFSIQDISNRQKIRKKVKDRSGAPKLGCVTESSGRLIKTQVAGHHPRVLVSVGWGPRTCICNKGQVTWMRWSGTTP